MGALQGVNEAAQEVLLGETPAALTNGEVIAGLKEALKVGANKAVDISSVTDGFYKNPALFIPFPEEAQKVKDIALDVGLGNQVDNFERTLNRAAEEAARQAAPIFVNVITGMTIQDGFNILNGPENAATEYLKSKTTPELSTKLSPVVSQAIDKVELTKYWEPLITKYNTVTMFTGGEEINPDLEAYVTERAIDGLFVHIAAEEKSIREYPEARITDILKKVFDQQ